MENVTTFVDIIAQSLQNFSYYHLPQGFPPFKTTKLSSHAQDDDNNIGLRINPVTLLTLTVAFLAIVLSTMTSTMPGFLARLTRPFTSATKLGVASENGGTAAPAAAIPEGAHRATVAAGCFWGVEHIYRKHFDGKGLYDARVGYIGGDTKNPSYRAVCTGETGRELFLDESLKILLFGKGKKEDEEIPPTQSMN